MTKKDLSQLYWLNQEIQEDKRRLLELEAASASCTAKITGLPHVGGHQDKIGDLAVLIAAQRDLIAGKLRRSVDAYGRLNQYIATVDDAQMRIILSLRYVNGLSWPKIAQHMGLSGDGSTQRKQHDAFLGRFP